MAGIGVLDEKFPKNQLKNYVIKIKKKKKKMGPHEPPLLNVLS